MERKFNIGDEVIRKDDIEDIFKNNRCSTFNQLKRTVCAVFERKAGFSYSTVRDNSTSEYGVKEDEIVPFYEAKKYALQYLTLWITRIAEME